MTNYKVFIWDNDNPGHRIYLVAANNRDEVVSKFDNIFRNNPSYIFESMIELVVDSIPKFQNFVKY